MRVLFYGLLTLVCLALAGLTFVMIAGPSDLLARSTRGRRQGPDGRDLAINGATSFKVYPNLGLAMEDVTLSDPPDMGAAPFLRIARLEVAVPFRALLRQKLAVERVVLKGAVVDLRIDATGRRNWDFALARCRTGPDEQPAASRASHSLASADGGASVLRMAAVTNAERLAGPVPVGRRWPSRTSG